MESIKVNIKRDCIEDLKADDNFITAIQLARIVNSLRSNLRSYTNVSNKDELLDTKDRIDLLLIHAALLFEAIQEFSRFRRKLNRFSTWNDRKADIERFNNEISDNNSFTNTILKRIRNKVFFHFDRDVLSDTLQLFNFSDEVTFALGKSTKRGEVTYSLIDDLILTYLVNIANRETPPIKEYDRIEQEILSLSDILCSVFDLFTKECLKGKLEFFEISDT